MNKNEEDRAKKLGWKEKGRNDGRRILSKKARALTSRSTRGSTN